MAGNAAEMTSDYYESSPASNPTGPDRGDTKIVRGSSFAYGTQSIRTSNRIEGNLTSRNAGRGFRCAMSAP